MYPRRVRPQGRAGKTGKTEPREAVGETAGTGALRDKEREHVRSHARDRTVFGIACLFLLGLTAFLGTGAPFANAAETFPGQGFLPHRVAKQHSYAIRFLFESLDSGLERVPQQHRGAN